MEDRQSRVQRALDRTLKSLVFRPLPGLPPADLPLSQLRCLHLISESEGIKVADLAHLMAVKLPAASQIVDRLVKRGLVLRHPDPQDRRVVRLLPSAEAREMRERLREARQSRLQATLAHLSPAEAEQVIAGLELLAGAAETHAAEEGTAPAPADPETSREVLARRAAPATP